jgi:putative phage-type endonuclease
MTSNGNELLKNSRIVLLVQGSPEWVSFRKRYFTATEISMITNPNCWGTFERQKLSTRTFKSKAMIEGNRLEPEARNALEYKLGVSFYPAVFVNDDRRLLASLDGISIGRRHTCEIKCPEKGVDSKLWQDAIKGFIPKRYRDQMQQGLLLTNADLCKYWVYDKITKAGVLIDVYPDPDYQRKILKSSTEYIQERVLKRFGNIEIAS